MKIQLLVVITARKRRSSNLGLRPSPPFATVPRQPGLDPANRGPDGGKPRILSVRRFMFSGSVILNGAGQTQMSTIALIDTRLKIPGESIGAVISTHDNIRAAFKANEAFQKRMRESGVKETSPRKSSLSKYDSATESMLIQARTCFSGGKVKKTFVYILLFAITVVLFQSSALIQSPFSAETFPL